MSFEIAAAYHMRRPDLPQFCKENIRLYSSIELGNSPLVGSSGSWDHTPVSPISLQQTAAMPQGVSFHSECPTLRTRSIQVLRDIP